MENSKLQDDFNYMKMLFKEFNNTVKIFLTSYYS